MVDRTYFESRDLWNIIDMDATNNILKPEQVYALVQSMKLETKVKLQNEHPDLNKYELDSFLWKVYQVKVEAILCTLTNDAYENITKVVHDKLNLNDLFDNRHKYLN